MAKAARQANSSIKTVKSASTKAKLAKPAGTKAKAKPAKAPDPLYKHANGQWYNTIRGKKHYFGTDLDAALEKYHVSRSPTPNRSERQRPRDAG